MVPIDYVPAINQLVAADRSEELNAGPFYKKAFDLYVERPDQLKQLNQKTWVAGLSAEQQPALEKWLQQNSPAFDELKKGADKPHCWFRYEGGSMWEIKPPHLLKARRLADALCWRAKVKAARGEFKDAFSDLGLCYRYGMHWSGTGPVFEQLAGITITAISNSAAFRILDNTKAPADQLKEFQQQLEKLSAEYAHIIGFAVEKFVMYDTAQGAFTDYNSGLPRISQAQLDKMKGMLKLSDQQVQDLKQVDGPNTIEITDKVYNYFGEAARKTPWQLHKENQNIKETAQRITKGNPFVPIFLPDADRVTQLSWRNKAAADALITTLAVLRYKTDKGQLPDKLDLLVSEGCLKQLPMDPYGDKPLVYKKTSDNFTLYSLGADFDDDSGAPSNWGEGQKGGDMVFWPVQRPKESADKKQVTNARTHTEKE
ncbi:MAG TPA: hypothetical protein VMX13_14465 [Sedimentisphaerales bacterium]|nr:hypothetical protein [Sedimentisphaerales bacterium]